MTIPNRQKQTTKTNKSYINKRLKILNFADMQEITFFCVCVHISQCFLHQLAINDKTVILSPHVFFGNKKL